MPEPVSVTELLPVELQGYRHQGAAFMLPLARSSPVTHTFRETAIMTLHIFPFFSINLVPCVGGRHFKRSEPSGFEPV